ncbi:MAG: dNTP triphosphohydrolase [Myxococcaceae bacterium]|nr:dNTP triphosphohydrolase [Myxococcaceae bacterium]
MKNRQGKVDVEVTSDYGRAIFSSSIRRLQQKAQVFPLEDNAAVRSRLTHSLEVAYLGRTIAQKIVSGLRGARTLSPAGASAFVTLVETSCLVHDIGNPPFGHFGENEIRKWCSKHWEKVVGKCKPTDSLVMKRLGQDFSGFDGNPQGFRILTRLAWARDKHGMNLTHATLCAAQKYCGTPDKVASRAPLLKKPGWFFSEDTIASAARVACGVREMRRHPAVFVMESADDIAYCLSDIEDGFEKGVYDVRLFRRNFKRLLERELGKASIKLTEARLAKDRLVDVLSLLDSRDPHPVSAPFFKFKVWLTRVLVESAAEGFVVHYDKIVAQDMEAPILESNPVAHAVLEGLKAFAREYLFCSPEAEQMELAGAAAIRGILDAMNPLLELAPAVFQALNGGRFKIDDLRLDAPPRQNANEPENPDKRTENHAKRSALEQRLARLLPEKHVLAYGETTRAIARQYPEIQHDSVEQYGRVHLIIDYLSGMTDGFALALYQRLSGTHAGLGRA